MENNNFDVNKARYYNIEKSQIHPLVHKGQNRVFDMGCGTGRLGRKLMELKKASELTGVEIFSQAAEEARKYYDKVYHGDIETLELNYEDYFDYIICGDILEHLLDPWEMLKKVHVWLKQEGLLICSIPNIRNWRIIKDLVLFGKWEYREAGILDRTHLRFFTRSTIMQSLNEAGFEIIDQEVMIWGIKKTLCNNATFGIFKDFLGSQFLISAKKKSNR